MADVFISYRNTQERRALVRRFAAILWAHEITVWWDYGLEAGESYRAQITTELANARIVAPLWCAESVVSPWVKMEAELGKDKLVPARLQKVVPPDEFEAIQAADLIGWDGAVGNPRLLAYVRKIAERLGRSAIAPTDMIEELGHLPKVPPLPEMPVASVQSASTDEPTHDYAFWKAEWDTHRGGTDLVALQAIVDHGPPYFASQARSRIAQIEEERGREEERQRVELEKQKQLERQKAERERAEREKAERFAAEGRIRIDAPIIHGAPDGWFLPGNGKTEWFKDFENGPEMVVIPAGKFMMGSPAGEEGRSNDEGPQHEVTIAKPFAVGRFAITFDEWDAAVASGGIKHKPSDQDWGRGRRPVINVSWEDAQAYIKWLNAQTDKAYRLLTEAAWEYACRAGTTTAYHWGDKFNSSKASNGSQTVPVGEYDPNKFGLYDMHGNVWEWCEDTGHENYKGAPSDGTAWVSGNQTSRVLRGGSWYNSPQYLRFADRNGDPPVVRDNAFGFRLARTLNL